MWVNPIATVVAAVDDEFSESYRFVMDLVIVAYEDVRILAKYLFVRDFVLDAAKQHTLFVHHIDSFR
jgi:hypothetical protein